jgi:hypothetical protein
MSNTSPLNVCFTELSTIQSMYYNQYNELATSWELFRRVELYNSNVSTLRGNGDLGYTYWTFANSEERSYYRQGAALFYQYLGYTSTIQKN